MKRSIVETKKAPPPVGPYSQAIQAGNMVFVSGQIAIHHETNEIPEDFNAQCHQVLKNLQAKSICLSVIAVPKLATAF